MAKPEWDDGTYRRSSADTYMGNWVREDEVDELQEYVEQLEKALVELWISRARYISPYPPPGGYEAFARKQLIEDGVLRDAQE